MRVFPGWSRQLGALAFLSVPTGRGGGGSTFMKSMGAGPPGQVWARAWRVGQRNPVATAAGLAPGGVTDPTSRTTRPRAPPGFQP